MAFPRDFVWGAAAASYQIEGAAYEDGKGLSVWDMLCKKPGAIWRGHTGDVACDHYHRCKEDVALMKQIGLQAYRFSISWPRVIPNGVGSVNPKGLEFYDKLVDELLANDIAPYVTLFHWDYPYELYLKGGWTNRESADWFADYTRVIVDKLSDRVQNWMTLNEPQCFIILGLSDGNHAPGVRLTNSAVMRGVHNTLLGHGKATQVIRAHAKTTPKVALVTVASVRSPETNSQKDIEAAKKSMFSINGTTDWWANGYWCDPVYKGSYHEDVLKIHRENLPDTLDEDMKTISEPLDFLAMNIYRGERVKAGEEGKPQILADKEGDPTTAYGWQVTPECMYWGSKFYFEEYGLPIAVTENGMSGIDWVALDGKVHDPQRIDFLNRYLLEYGRAGEDGVPIQAYFQWSIMDNFEWAQGYKERFGMIHVDYQTQKRTLKDSAYWYSQVIKTNGESLHA